MNSFISLIQFSKLSALLLSVSLTTPVNMPLIIPIFIAATSPVTGNGRIIFAIGLGVLTVLFRNYGPMPEGVAFSILIMNAFTPLIDKYIRPKPFGYQRKKKNA